MKAIFCLAVSLFVSGCGVSFSDTKTIHNADATRIWLIQKNPGGDEKIIFCEAHWVSRSGQLCTVYNPDVK